MPPVIKGSRILDLDLVKMVGTHLPPLPHSQLSGGKWREREANPRVKHPFHKKISQNLKKSSAYNKRLYVQCCIIFTPEKKLFE